MESRQKILISVVVPAFNAQDTIEAALRSVKEAWGRVHGAEGAIEIIVVDDASTDSTAEVVRAWGEGRVAKLSSCQVVKFGEREGDGKQDRGLRIDVSVNTPATASFLCSSQPTTEQLNNSLALRIFVLDKNAGPAAARNRGIAEARGDWIAFLDADDEWLPGKLELQMRMAEAHPEIDLWCGEVAPMAPQTIDYRPQTIPKASQCGRRAPDRRQKTEDHTQSFAMWQASSRQKTEDGRRKTEDRGRQEGEESGEYSTTNPARSIASWRTGHAKATKEGDTTESAATPCSMLYAPCFSQSATKEPNNPATSQLYQELTLADFVVANPVGTTTVMVRKSALDEVGGFDEQFRGPEDYDLWLRVAARGKEQRAESRVQRDGDGDRGRTSDVGSQSSEQLRMLNAEAANLTTEQLNNSATAICHMAKLHAPLARYRSETGSLSMDDRKFLPQVLRVLDKAFGEGGALAEFADMKKLALANQYRSASWMAFCRGSRLEAIRLWWKGYRLGTSEQRWSWWKVPLRYILGRTGHDQ